MNVGWLRKLLHRFPSDMEVFINVDGVMWPLCGKADLTLLTYITPEEPEVEMGEQALCLKPCHCDEEEKINEENEQSKLN